MFLFNSIMNCILFFVTTYRNKRKTSKIVMMRLNCKIEMVDFFYIQKKVDPHLSFQKSETSLSFFYIFFRSLVSKRSPFNEIGRQFISKNQSHSMLLL